MRAFFAAVVLLGVVQVQGGEFYYKPIFVEPFDSSFNNQIRPSRSSSPTPTPKPTPTSPPPSYSPAPRYGPTPSYNYGPVKYDFDWNVLDTYSGNDYGHRESRVDKSTTGSYHVALPDGRIQTVTYTVDGYGGYVAEVSYEGSAAYPEAKPYHRPAPKYPAPPTYHPVQPYSSASESRAAYSVTPAPKKPEAEAKSAVVATPVKSEPAQPVQKAQPVTAAPVVTAAPTIRRYTYRTTAPRVKPETEKVEIAERREDTGVEEQETNEIEPAAHSKPYERQDSRSYYYRFY